MAIFGKSIRNANGQFGVGNSGGLMHSSRSGGYFDNKGRGKKLLVERCAGSEPFSEKDFTNSYHCYIWIEFRNSWKFFADRVLKWEVLEVDYYRGVLDNGNVIFYDAMENSCREMTKEEAEFPTEESWLREFARRLRRAMEVKGFDQLRLSEETGISQGSLSGYCLGKRCPSSYSSRLIAEALDCSLDFLLNF